MSLVEPYSPCPCGSGEKYKWCCQKVEPFAERAQRLLENGQFESALVPLNEGLAKFPDSPLLLTRKAVTHLHLEQFEEAKGALRSLLQKRRTARARPSYSCGSCFKPRDPSRPPGNSNRRFRPRHPKNERRIAQRLR